MPTTSILAPCEPATGAEKYLPCHSRIPSQHACNFAMFLLEDSQAGALFLPQVFRTRLSSLIFPHSLLSPRSIPRFRSLRPTCCCACGLITCFYAEFIRSSSAGTSRQLRRTSSAISPRPSQKPLAPARRRPSGLAAPNNTLMPPAPPWPLVVIFRYQWFANARTLSEEQGASPMIRGLPSRRGPELALALVLPAGGPATPRPPAAPRNHGAWPLAPPTPHSPRHP